MSRPQPWIRKKVGEVLELIQTIAAAGQTMIIVTHEMAFARQVASRVVFMENGEIVEQGPAEQIFGAAQQGRTRRFLRNCTIMPEADDEQ